MGNPHGAFGAKGIGELPMDGPAPAIVNAIVDALGVDFNSVPLLAEDIFEQSTQANAILSQNRQERHVEFAFAAH